MQHCWETEATNAGIVGLYPQRSAHCTCFPPSAVTSQPQYEVLARELLHDLKSHIRNLLAEISYLLPPPLKLECTKVIETTLGKQKRSGARLRVAIINVFLKVLRHQDIDVMVKELLGALVKIPELLYANDTSPTPKAVLQLYNITWLHNELCCHLISN